MKAIYDRLFGALCLLFLLAACGGSGGSDYAISRDSGGSTPPAGSQGYQMGSMVDGSFIPGRLALSVDDHQALVPGSVISVSALILDAQGHPYEDPILVDFDSTMNSLAQAHIDPPFTHTVNGNATVLYQATGGRGEDTLTAWARIDGETLTATATLMVADTAALHIEFVSASHAAIALRNTGGPPRSETSALVFRVVDVDGTPVAGQTVDFQLSTTIGDLYLSTESGVSDMDGLVYTSVNAGTVSTEVKVHATVRESDPLATVVSDTLIISTGLADQNSLSLGPERHNPEGWDYNNVEVEVTFQAADHFNNFVPDGTVVYFTTELGAIDDACTLEAGACEVIWRSGNPRDSYCDDLLPACRKALATITAFLIGEESFVDFNGNGYYDPEDAFDTATDLAEPYRDDDDDGSRDDFEPWWDFDNDGGYDGAPNGIYNGSLCADEAEDLGLCSKELVFAQISTHIVMSGSFAHTFTLSSPGPGLVSLTIADLHGNPMPAESTVEIIKVSNGLTLGSFEIPSTLSGTRYTVRVGSGEEPAAVYATLTTPFDNLSYSTNTVTVD